MKLIKNFNKFTGFAAFSIAISLFFTSCIKNYRDGETNFSNLQPTVSIVEGGLAQFGSQALLFPGTDDADTAYFRVNYAATNVAPANETVTLGVDTAALDNYNGSGAGLTYVLLPDSCYSIPTSATVEAGQSYSAQVPVIVYPDKINPTINYMLPISIINAGKTNISGNFGTIYYHFIGNPIAGSYNWDWTRWNASDTTGAPTTSFTDEPTVFAPDDPTTVEVPSGYFYQARYIITFTNTGGVLSNFSVTLNAGDMAAYWPANGITLTAGPTILEADPIHGIYRFTYTVSTGSGPRIFIDQYYK
ncbi:MAG TPA: DUF1735 domain-containing protein [Hanamia sp.]|nr:DUF1735 domain-containing protein [Hanamia sp.]